MEKTLKEHLLGESANRPAILDDCEKLIEDELALKGGLSGVALKGGYRIVKMFKPGFIRAVLNDVLLDAFVDKLDRFYQDYMDGQDKNPDGFSDYLLQHSSAAADALLSITDERAQKTKHKTVKKAYNRLRGQAKAHVTEALPRAAAVLSRYVK